MRSWGSTELILLGTVFVSGVVVFILVASLTQGRSQFALYDVRNDGHRALDLGVLGLHRL